MKCSNTGCDWQGQGNFCQSCGNKMIPDAPAEVFIICSGTLDGVVCGAELKESQNFCCTCGSPVDKRLFASLQEKCKGCGAVLGPDSKFCAECGLKKGTVVPLKTAVGNTVEKGPACESRPVSETSHSTTDTLEGNTKNVKNLEESKLSKNGPEIESEKCTEIQDSETMSVKVEESESCDSSSASECGEQTDDKSTTTKKKNRGGRKAESKRKREHKSKVHAEKYNLKSKELSELETNVKEIGSVEEEQKEPPESKVQELHLNSDVCDDTNNNSLGNQTPVFGNHRQTEDNTDGDYSVVYPPDPTGPTFFSSGNNTRISQDSMKADSLNNDQENCKPVADAHKEIENTQRQFEESTNTQRDKQLNAEDKMQKDEKNKDEKTKTDSGRQTHVHKETDTSKANPTGGNGQIDVVFHILVPTNMIKDNRNVLLVFGAHEFGGWDSRKYALHTVKMYTGYTEMSFSLTMARNQLQRHLKYKYVVMKDKSKQSTEWEDYYLHTNADRFHNRRLFVEPHLVTKKEEWHQYDGVVTVKPSENILQKFGNWIVGKNEIDWESHPEDFARRLCPSWFKSDFNVMETTQTHHESIYHLECLYKGLRKIYLVDARTFSSDDAFATRFATWILTPLSECLVRQESASAGICVTVIRALCIVVVCDKLKLPLLEQTWQNVCRCLLVHADTVNNTCAELKDILEYFPDRKYLAKAVANFVNRVDRFGKNPSWLFCLPLIHFLEDICKPFGKVTTQRNHSDRVPRWWGIVEIQSAVDSFKRNSYRWQISLASILATMQPLFEMDFYLPRSIIACLKPVELREVIGEEILPVEVCCATLCCFIKRTKPSYNQGNQVSTESDVIGEEKTVVDCISKLKNRLQCYSIPIGSSRKQWWLAFMIAFECLQEAVSTKRTSKVIPSAQIFLHCVSVYQRICNQADSEEDKMETRLEEKHKELKEKACDCILSWLRTYASEYWMIRMAENLQVWNKAFVEQLKEEEVGIYWNECVANRLIQNLSLEKNTVTSEFLRHYCQHLDGYSGPLQDCLNRFALKAVEGGIDLDILSLREAEKARFATLLSEMFQREWRSVDIGEQDLREERILKMVLSWSPFRQFLKSLYNNEKCSCYLSKTCQNNLRSTTAVVHNSTEAIVTGNIRIGTLKYIQRNKNVFCEVVQEIMSEKKEISRVISKAVNIRIQEVQAFEEQADKIKAFVDLCTHFPEGIIVWLFKFCYIIVIPLYLKL
ncbi:E3 ubiquitin-protein ligase rnf213-alpha-like [Mercenaria mercenaria]|uniref:E3 ubiquitin-protein ligase rnf213-alpha-like n=1 Tax=Mercenaria mercenaria TaxID=6596 RepID=UPI00234F3679|nr:E3 ubiquitin-protein ligase rnf213-alpha-like [Mercenaria mercenaria]XP_053396358.1 E3 ubiquitin-protein ligase rnf213-alpha-like [Mercenaria mercenaria]